MSERYPTVTVTRTEASVLETNKVLRNTYLLLSMTLLFTAAAAGISMAVGVPLGASILCTFAALGVLWFVIPRTANSVNGIWAVFGVAGLLGTGLGPILTHYLALPNGGQVVMGAFGMTAAAFIGLSGYVITTGKSFRFMGGMLFTGIMVAFFASIGYFIAAMLGYSFQPLALGLSALWAMLMCGLILYETGEIVNGGQTNYILATVSLYVAIYNLFTNLLHLLGFAMGDD